MAFIREWVITIISVIIFVTFIEILIPNSNYKRYINVITGLLLIVVILTPLTKFINRQIDFEEEVLKIFNQLELSTARNRVNNIEYSNDEAVMALYKNKISEQIKSYIENNTEYIVSEVFVEVEDENSSQFGTITGLDITLREKTGNSKPANKTVKPVQINVSIGKNNNNTVEASSILISSKEDLIKGDISDLYDVSKDNINIHILRNN
ncbi:MAG: stage III sporulation protein AF [Natronincolaceae bacterium]|nr:stage III sporulation protein AF [Bacillota bacterium]NLK91488.1 stage III sporulation protein AF [Clostridiales bacterium]